MRNALTSCARAASVIVLLILVACGDSPVTPDDAGAQSSSTAAMFAEIIAKLETIEERIDSLEVSLNTSGGVSVSLDSVPALQIDSILALASFIALDATSGSWEACAHFTVTGEFGGEWKGEAKGKGAGHLGAWAGTGAYAGGELEGTAEIGGGVKVAAEGGAEGCVPLGGGAPPPARPAPSGPSRSPELDQLRTTLTGLTNQFNMTPASLTTSLNGVSTAISSPLSIDLANVGDVLPLPPALASVANDPLGTVIGGLQGLTSDAQDALCSGVGFGGPVSTVISDACDVIDSGGLANITAFADIASTYPAVQTVVSNVCGQVNVIGLRRLIIPSWDVTFPLGIGTVEVFPGYNQRLFPSYTTLACS